MRDRVENKTNWPSKSLDIFYYGTTCNSNSKRSDNKCNVQHASDALSRQERLKRYSEMTYCPLCCLSRLITATKERERGEQERHSERGRKRIRVASTWQGRHNRKATKQNVAMTLRILSSTTFNQWPVLEGIKGGKRAKGATRKVTSGI